MTIECHKCGKDIPEGEKFYCWSFSVEQIQGKTIKVDSAEVLKVHCMKCGPGAQKAEADAIGAALN